MAEELLIPFPRPSGLDLELTQDGDIDQRSISTWPGAAVQVLRSSLSTALTPVPAPVPAPAPPSHGRCATGDLSQSGSCDARGTHRESAAKKKTHSWTNPHLDATKAGVRPPRPASPASHQHPLSQWRQTQRSAPRRRPSRSIPFSRTLPNCQCLPKPPDTRLARFDSRSKNTSSLIWRLGHVGRHQHNQACLSWKPFFSFFAAEEVGDCAYYYCVLLRSLPASDRRGIAAGHTARGSSAFPATPGLGAVSVAMANPQSWHVPSRPSKRSQSLNRNGAHETQTGRGALSGRRCHSAQPDIGSFCSSSPRRVGRGIERSTTPVTRRSSMQF